MNNVHRIKVGQRIKDRRKALKMSADELGAKIGKNRATVYRYENGDEDLEEYEAWLDFISNGGSTAEWERMKKAKK